MINKNWIFVVLILIVIIIGGFFVMPGSFTKKLKLPIPKFLEKPFKLGLDLQGGTHLLYEADMSQIKAEDRQGSMEGLRDVIERRVNLFGVQEPVVQEQTGKGKYRLVVELAGIDDPKEAIEMIGQTPTLDFREEMSFEEKQKIVEEMSESEVQMIIAGIETQTGQKITKEKIVDYLPLYRPTKLTGKYLKSARLEFDPNTYKPQVSLEFNQEGAKIFQELTKKNIGKVLAIYIDNQLISSPVVQDEIIGGKAQITGEFTIEEAKKLARNLSAGALPAPIKLISQETIGPSLGKASIDKSIRAGLIGSLFIVIFMVLVYRFSGFLSVIVLLFYAVILLSLFKLVPITLTLAGAAGFILSLGMAVDANVLIFERLKEELRESASLDLIIDNAFYRAWPAIRDGHLTTMITCVILFFIASGFVQGFALVLFLGNICSMFSAMIITKIFVKAFGSTKLRNFEKIWTR